MNQADAFEKGEGDAWFARNKDKLGLEDDPVIDLIEQHVENVDFIFEVGCANGWRLKRIKELWGRVVEGIDPSSEAVEAAGEAGVPAYRGTAKNLGVDSGSVDVLIYGFCLYLCDPEDYFVIASEGDRVLKDGGVLIIHDFDAIDGVPRRVPYKHKEGIFSYHFEFETLWTGHPWYRTLETWYREDQSFTILKKDSKGAWK